MLQPHLCHLLFAAMVPQGEASLCRLLTLKVFLEPFLVPFLLLASLPRVGSAASIPLRVRCCSVRSALTCPHSHLLCDSLFLSPKELPMQL